jgi:AcrR family transcriptional regulator
MARPKAADYDETRDRILTRAVQAFAESGYPSASMSSLAERCDTSKAALYHYFDSKEAILFESLDRYTARLIELVEQAVTPFGGSAAFAAADPRKPETPQSEIRQPDASLPDVHQARSALATLIHALLVEYRDSRAYHVALLNDVKFLSPPQRAQIEAQERAVVATVSQVLALAAPGRFDDHEIRPAAMAILGMINFTFAWLRPDGPMSYERYAELVTGIALHGIATPDATASTG